LQTVRLRALLVSAHPAAAVNVKDERGGAPRLRLVEVDDLARMVAIGDILVGRLDRAHKGLRLGLRGSLRLLSDGQVGHRGGTGESGKDRRNQESSPRSHRGFHEHFLNQRWENVAGSTQRLSGLRVAIKNSVQSLYFSSWPG